MIVAAAGGDLDSLLNDPDGSETLSFVFDGLTQAPSSVNDPSGILYLGSNKYQVSRDAMVDLVIPLEQHLSGNSTDVFPGLVVTTVSQEIEGDQASSPEWTIDFELLPVADGFATWSPGQTINEQDLDSGNVDGIFLGDGLPPTLIDSDGSEMILNYTFDFSNFLDDAGVRDQLISITGGDTFSDLLSQIEGVYTYDEVAMTVTVEPANLAGFYIRGLLFYDSNVDFSLAVFAWYWDRAVIGGSYEIVYGMESGSYSVDMVGHADTPTAFATASIMGVSGTAIPFLLGGDTTDTDAALGRSVSESQIYYIIEAELNGISSYAIADSSGMNLGLAGGDNTWLLFEDDLADLNVFVPLGENGTIDFTTTTVVIENDGDIAYANFSFLLTAEGPTGTEPNPVPNSPIAGTATAVGTEDMAVTLDMMVMADNSGAVMSYASVEISGLPSGATVNNATLNPLTNVWIADAEAVDNGYVSINPPLNLGDESSSMASWTFYVEAVATNQVYRNSTGLQAVDLVLNPVADAIDFSFSSTSSLEDMSFMMSVVPTLFDGDGSESFYGPYVYVYFSELITIIGPSTYMLVGAGVDEDLLFAGDWSEFYRIPVADIGSLELLGPVDFHGSVTTEIRAVSVENFDPTNPSYQLVSSDTFNIFIDAIADTPLVTVPTTMLFGTQGEIVDLTGLLAVVSNDTDPTTSAEQVFAVLSGVPEGTLFSHGFNNGNAGSADGSFSWSIPVDDLAMLMMTPPPYFGGLMNLTLTGIALEDNGSEAQFGESFVIELAAVPDDVLTLAENVFIADTSGVADLITNVRLLDTTGTTYEGELAPETVQITFDNVPAGVFFRAPMGGSFSADNNGVGGTVVFTGTEAQANELEVVSLATATVPTLDHIITMMTVTIDDTVALGTPVSDQFQLELTAVSTNVVDAATGTGGSDLIIPAGSGGSLTGGGGADTFVFADADLGGGASISDFSSDDQVDVSQILASAGVFDLQTSELSEFVALSSGTLSVSPTGNGSFTNVVSGLSSLTDIGIAYENGSLVV